MMVTMANAMTPRYVFQVLWEVSEGKSPAESKVVHARPPFLLRLLRVTFVPFPCYILFLSISYARDRSYSRDTLLAFNLTLNDKHLTYEDLNITRLDYNMTSEQFATLTKHTVGTFAIGTVNVLVPFSSEIPTRWILRL
jgi:hypothetical protein